jgi:hypothetical protein
MPEEITKYTDLISKVVARLAKIWEMKEGDLTIEVRSDKDKTMARISGGETERIK